MATTHDYDVATELGGETDLIVLMGRVISDGTYTIPQVRTSDNVTITVTVDEDSVPKATLETILTTAVPTLSLDKSSVTIANDGVATDTVTVTDSRGASASGLVVKLRWNGINYADANSLTLNGSGQGTVTFGPCPSSECTSGDGLIVTFYSDADSFIVPVSCVVKYQ
jgi:hypothetical protein